MGAEIAEHEYDHLAFFQNKLTTLVGGYPAQPVVSTLLQRNI